MKYTFIPITMNHVKEISTWRYDGFMKSIYMKPYYDNFNPQTNETKGPDNCSGFAVYLNDTLCGLYEYYFYNGILEIGLALHPEFVGKGYSQAFIEEGIQFGISTFHYKKEFVQLHVEVDNKTAYHAYLKMGFKIMETTDNEVLMYYYLN